MFLKDTIPILTLAMNNKHFHDEKEPIIISLAVDILLSKTQ